MLIVLTILLLIPFSEQPVFAKRVPMGHPSLVVHLLAGPDSRSDFMIVEDEETIQTLKTDVDAKLYGILDRIILPEIRKEFDEKRNIYSDSYVEGISGYYDLDNSKLDILISNVPPEHGCNTEGCAHRRVTAQVPAELKPSNFKQMGFSIAVYQNMTRDLGYDDLVERIMMKATTEAEVLFSEAANVLEHNRERLMEDGTAIEIILLSQYEDISRISVLFLASEPGVSSEKKPLDIVIKSNSYY